MLHYTTVFVFQSSSS